jgi:phosphate-selective porin OprO and OprP
MTAGERSEVVTNQAWQIYAGMALTDDEWGFFGIVPRRPFDPTRGQYGAVALAARYSSMYIDPLAFPHFADPDRSIRNAHAGALSLHWVYNENLKTQFDFEATAYDGGAPGGADRATELTFVGRVQGFY